MTTKDTKVHEGQSSGVSFVNLRVLRGDELIEQLMQRWIDLAVDGIRPLHGS